MAAELATSLLLQCGPPLILASVTLLNCGKKKNNASTAGPPPGPAGGVGPRAPENANEGGMAGTHDPNYQTMANVGGDCFGADKKSAEGPKAPANQGAEAGTHDPNYQTMAGIAGGNECFGADKKK